MNNSGCTSHHPRFTCKKRTNFGNAVIGGNLTLVYFVSHAKKKKARKKKIEKIRETEREWLNQPYHSCYFPAVQLTHLLYNLGLLINQLQSWALLISLYNHGFTHSTKAQLTKAQLTNLISYARMLLKHSSRA